MRDLIGQTLGHYRIVEKIGEGGMGEVYRAHDERLDRDVAVKVLPEEVASDHDRVRRFEREAKAVAALSHPNILAIHDFGIEDGVAYAVMELLEGESLREQISRGGITTGKAVEYARAIADGLAAAHGKNIVHRDLKPENVFLTTDGRIKILDFGLAKLKLPETDLATETPTESLGTTPGKLLGTLAYMAPEQLQGGAADHRSDIFAFGVVLYEMLTGRRPFGGGTSAEVAAEIIKTDPTPMAESVPQTVKGVVSKCLEKRPEDRFSSAHDLSLILGSIDSKSIAPPAREKSFVQRRWSYLAAVVVAAIIALVFLLPAGGLFKRLAEKPAEAAVPRIVVLPFENLGSPEDEYFADGMTEEITSRLAAVSGLHVISRTSAMHFKGAEKTVREIGEELDVQYVLEGTVRWDRREDGTGVVRITPQLIQVADDRHLWSDRYDRAIEKVFEVQSGIAIQVVGQLGATLSEAEGRAVDARPTGNPEAYEAYLRGLRYYPESEKLEDIQIGVSMFERAVELDPEFALAWALLAEMYGVLYHYNIDRTPERQAAAKRAAERALSLDPTLPEGQRAMGYYYYFCRLDYANALASFARVLEARPNDTRTMMGQGGVIRRQGRWMESTDLLERAFSLDPKDDNLACMLSLSYSILRNHERAEEYANLAISLAPDKIDGYLYKWDAFRSQGCYREAWQVLEDVPVQAPELEFYRVRTEIAERRFEAALTRVHDTPVAVWEAAWGKRHGARRRVEQECRCYFYLGDQEGIQEACGRALALAEERVLEDPEHPGAHGQLGRLYAMLGRRNDAIREGKRAVELLPVSKEAVNGPVHVETLAVIYVLVGELDAAVGELDAAVDQIEYLMSIPYNLTVGELRNHPVWDPLRDHPRFQALLEKYDTD